MPTISRVPLRYLPNQITNRDKKRQSRMLMRSRKLYKQGKYYTRKPIPSFHSKPSNHIVRARKIYNVQHIAPGPELSKATGCSVSALDDIVKKGEGAYFSSGSRPNQTAQSWGYARLASAITAGKSAAIDFTIIEKGCNHRKRAYKYALQSRKKYGYGHGRTRKTVLQ